MGEPTIGRAAGFFTLVCMGASLLTGNARAGDATQYWAVTGVASGIAAAIGLTRFLSSFLYEVGPTDSVTFAVVSCTLIGVSLAASYLPVRRATKVDPIVALRQG